MCAFVYFSNEHGGFCYCIDKDHLSILVNALERLGEEVHLLLDIQIVKSILCSSSSRFCLFCHSRVSLAITKKKPLPKFKFLESWDHLGVLIDTDLVEMERFIFPIMTYKRPNVLIKLKRKLS